MRKNILKQRRGFTLVELTIVLAVMAIISTMIVSFSVLISAQVDKNDARADFLEQTASFRTDIQHYFATIDTPGATFAVSEDDKNIDFGNEKKFTVNEKKYSQIKSVEVAAQGSLLKITVGNGDLTQSFTLFSHCGAEFNTQGGN